MKQANVLDTQDLLIQKVSELPSKILKHHETQNLPQVLLTYLGHQDCFDLERAAYIVDNPDFDHMVGIAGFAQKDFEMKEVEELWGNPIALHDTFMNLNFNKRVKNYLQDSLNRRGLSVDNSKSLLRIGKELGLSNSQSLCWNLKHGNHGLFLFEPKKEMSTKEQHLLKTAAMMLGFCSLF